MVAPCLVTAHQGGWDEAQMALTPVALLIGLVVAASRRSRDDEADGTEEQAPR